MHNRHTRTNTHTQIACSYYCWLSHVHSLHSSQATKGRQWRNGTFRMCVSGWRTLASVNMRVCLRRMRSSVSTFLILEKMISKNLEWGNWDTRKHSFLSLTSFCSSCNYCSHFLPVELSFTCNDGDDCCFIMHFIIIVSVSSLWAA